MVRGARSNKEARRRAANCFWACITASVFLASASAAELASAASASAAELASAAPPTSAAAAEDELSAEIDLDAVPTGEILLLPGRKFPLDLAGGGLQIHGTPLFVRELPNTGLGTAFTVWDGSIVLAKHLEHAYASGLGGKRVLELGAGTGVVGLAASMLGADVLLTDLPVALDNLRAGVRLNARAAKGAPVEAHALDWFAPERSQAAWPDAARSIARGADLVVGADIVWVPELIAPLVRTLRFVADQRAQGSAPLLVLIAHQTRSRSSDATLFRELKAARFAAAALPRSAHHPRFSDADIEILEIRDEAGAE